MIALVGILGPLVFTLVVIVAGLARPGYSQQTQFISELGERDAPGALFVNVAGFDMLGVLLVLFAIGLRQKAVSVAPWLLLGVAGLIFLVFGFSSCDPGCPLVPRSPPGWAHFIAGIGSLVVLPLVPMIAARRSRLGVEWAGFARFSLLMGGALVAAALLFIVLVVPLRAASALIERVFFGCFFVWLVGLALRLSRSPMPALHRSMG